MDLATVSKAATATAGVVIKPAVEKQEAGGVRWKRSKYVLSPAGENEYVRHWETLCGLALLFVCIVTPYEVAFLETEVNALFIINQAINLIFIFDMGLQFFVMQEVRGRYGTVHIFNHGLIVSRYLRSWFIIDLISIVPFDTISVAGTDEDGSVDSDLSRLKLVRSVRLLRLLKLVKLLRGMAVFERWEVSMNLSFRKLTLCQMALRVLVTAHWIGCLLGIVSTFQGVACIEVGVPEGCVHTWVSGADPNERGDHFGIFLVAMYTAVTVLVHPHALEPKSANERIVFIILMFFGGWIWTHVISQSTAISASLDRHLIAYHQTMDDLNDIADQFQLSTTLRQRLRRFFLNTHNCSQRRTWEVIMKRMSPNLRSQVAHELNRSWLRCVRFLLKCSPEFLSDISQQLRSKMYGQSEQFGVPFTLYILNHGLGVRPASFFIRRPGAVWGEEHLLLTCWWLLDPTTTLALTFVEVLELERHVFASIAEDHPEDSKSLRRHYLVLALRQGLLYEVRQQKALANNNENVQVHDGRTRRHILRVLAQGVDVGSAAMGGVGQPPQADDLLGAMAGFGGGVAAGSASAPGSSVPVAGAGVPASSTQSLTQTGKTPHNAFLFWGDIEERLEQHVTKLHSSLLNRLEEQTVELENKILDNWQQLERKALERRLDLERRLIAHGSMLPPASTMATVPETTAAVPPDIPPVIVLPPAAARPPEASTLFQSVQPTASERAAYLS